MAQKPRKKHANHTFLEMRFFCRLDKGRPSNSAINSGEKMSPGATG